MLKKIYWELLCGFRDADAEFSGVGLFCVMFSGRQWDALPEETKQQYRNDYKHIGYVPSLDAHLIVKNSRKWLGPDPPPRAAHLHNPVFLMVEEQHQDAG